MNYSPTSNLEKINNSIESIEQNISVEIERMSYLEEGYREKVCGF